MDENLANLRSKSRQLCNLFLPTKLKYEEDEIDEDEEKEVDDTSLSKESQFIKVNLFKPENDTGNPKNNPLILIKLIITHVSFII